MLNKNRFFVSGVLMAVLLVVAACGSDSGSAETGADSFKISYSTWASDGEPAYEGMEKFKEIMEDESNGRITVELFPANQLGTTDEQLEQLEIGSLDMMSSGNPGISELEYLSLPYLMKSNDHWLEVMNSDIGAEWNEQLIDSSGLRNIGLLPRGPRVVSANKEIQTPSDMDGLKIRVPERDYYVQTFDAFGSNPTPMDFGEVYSALQTGVVNGQENPLETIYAAGFQEVQDYIITTHHMYKPAFVSINEEFYQNLSDEDEELLLKATKAGQEYASQVMDEESSKMREEMKEAGVTFIEPDLKPFIEATQSVRDSLGTKIWGEEVYEEIKKMGQKDL